MPIPTFIADIRKLVGQSLLLLPTIVVIARDRQGRILLVHDRDSDNWTLPGGIIEPGEAPADAAVREVWEETQVQVTLTHIVGVVGGPGCETHYRNGDRIAWVATVFAATVASSAEPVSDGSETMAARFVTPADMAKLHLRADTQRFLQADRDCPLGGFFQAPSWRP